VHLMEGDCSVQRGNQKVFEESPAPGLSWELRSAMGQSAVNAALACKYEGAGTVEFLVDPDTMSYYFMEMNTRLQVEHPVTEMIVGRDLVQWQLHVAAGYPLPCSQDDIVLNGHAIEARIYAEEYNKSLQRFTASSGTLHHLKFPTVRNEGGHNVRCESGVYEGGVVSTHYDAMIAKLITHCDGNDDSVRGNALKLMQSELEQFEVSGLQTNIEFLKRVLLHDAFIKGGVTTDFIPNYSKDLFEATEIDSDYKERATAFASLGCLLWFGQNVETDSLIGYATNGNVTGSNVGRRMKLFDVKQDDVCYDSVIKRGENDCFVIDVGQRQFVVNECVLSKDAKSLMIRTNEEYIECNVSFYDNKVTIFYNGKRSDFVHSPNVNLSVPPEFVKGKGGIVIAPQPDTDSPVIMHKSPMQAKVFDISVAVGDSVKKGQMMGSVESMKQLYEVWAQCDGVITDIVVSNEESVNEGQVLIKVERQEQAQKVEKLK